jgi:hypothetical protein
MGSIGWHLRQVQRLARNGWESQERLPRANSAFWEKIRGTGCTLENSKRATNSNLEGKRTTEKQGEQIVNGE